MFSPKVVSRYQGHVLNLKFCRIRRLVAIWIKMSSKSILQFFKPKQQDVLVDSTNVDKCMADLCSEQLKKCILQVQNQKRGGDIRFYRRPTKPKLDVTLPNILHLKQLPISRINTIWRLLLSEISKLNIWKKFRENGNYSEILNVKFWN